jgi:hypothetical protein
MPVSSEIMVYGFIEMPHDSEAANVDVFKLLSQYEDELSIVTSVSPIRRGWLTSICSFAVVLKRTTVTDCDRIRDGFEDLLFDLRALSAHLTMEDPGAGDMHYLDYVYGPVHFGDSDRWSRVRSARQREDMEKLDPPSRPIHTSGR